MSSSPSALSSVASLAADAAEMMPPAKKAKVLAISGGDEVRVAEEESGFAGGDEVRVGEEPRFALVAINLAGEHRAIEGLHPSMMVSDLKGRVMEAFGYGDCTHSFQDLATFCIDKEPLKEPSQTLQEVGVSPTTLVDFVITEPLLILKVSDNKVLRVVHEVACMSGRIKAAVAEHGLEKEISLPDCNIDGVIKAMEYCAHHRKAPASIIVKPLASTNLLECGASEWDVDLLPLEQELLFELILVAKSLDIQGLLDLSCAKVACMIKGKTSKEIRKQFNIVNDFTPEEEAQVREENRWCEDA